MTTRKKTNYIIAVVLTTLVLFLLTVGVSYGAKKPSPKSADEPKSKQMTKKKTDQFLQRVEKNNPKRAARLRQLRRDDPAKFRQTVRKELTAGAKKSKTQEGKATKANSPGGGRGRGGQFAQMGWRRGGRGRGGRFATMDWRRGGPGRGGRFAEMGRQRDGRGRGERFAPMDWRRGGRGRGGRFAEMDRPGGGRGRGERFAPMDWRRGGRGRGGRFAQMDRRRGGPRGRQFGRAKHPRPDESDIWDDDD